MYQPEEIPQNKNTGLKKIKFAKKKLIGLKLP